MDLSISKKFISIYKIIIKIMINVNKMPSKTRAVSLIFTSFIFFRVHGTFLSAKKRVSYKDSSSQSSKFLQNSNDSQDQNVT